MDTVVDNDRTDRLIDQTLQVWQSRTSRELSREDAREITENTVGFFQTLRRWAREAPADILADVNAQQQFHGRGGGGPS